MWYLWEASNGKFCVTCEMQEMDPWKIRKSKQGDGLMDSVEELCEEVEMVRGLLSQG